MIDAVKQGVCSVYGNYNVNNTAENINNIKSHQVNKFDIKELLADIQGCTYNEEDVNAVDEKLMERLREKFDLEKEDVYKLKNKGFDLEMLYVEDYSGYMKDSKKKSSKSVSEDDKESLKHKIETIKTGSDNMYLSALVSQKDITINSLYESNFKGNYKKNGITFKDADIDNVLNMNKLENNEQNTWAAKLLLSHGMDVNAENVMKLDNIQTIVDSLDDFIENEKRIEELAGGKAIGDHLLLKDGKIVYDYEGIKSLKKDLGQVTEEDIKEVLEEDKTVSIKNLKEVMHKNTQLALNGNAKTNVIRGIVTLQDVEAVKTQINQIRAKLTVEAAQKISEKMPLESSSLSNVVEEMLVVENAKIEEALKAVDLEATAENKEMLQDVLETKVLMMDSLSYTIHLEVESDGNITLERINGALKAYGENESVAETRFGESIKIVENQIEKLLQNQGIEATEKTIAAAKSAYYQ